jgi:hypothetical protein
MSLFRQQQACAIGAALAERFWRATRPDLTGPTRMTAVLTTDPTLMAAMLIPAPRAVGIALAGARGVVNEQHPAPGLSRGARRREYTERRVRQGLRAIDEVYLTRSIERELAHSEVVK